MKNNESKKLQFKIIISLATFGVLAYIALQFYLSKGNIMIFPWLQLDSVSSGIIIIVLIGIISTILYYYKSRISVQADESPHLRSELGAYEIVADEIKKCTNNMIKTSIDEVKQARIDHRIDINSSRLTSTLIKGDYIRLSSGPDMYNPFIDCVIESILIE